MSSLGENQSIRPFIKWVGGKHRLLPQLRKLYPLKFNNYFEPFLGGGAVFLDLKPKKAFLNDINKALIASYQHIKKNPNELIKLLNKIQKQYYNESAEGQHNLYYDIRSKYNRLNNGSFEKTAYLIFLNKTGYNGLYRESSTGGYNVPFGKSKKPAILDEDNLLAVADALKKVTLTALSFEKAVASAKKGDFVYFDPPYYPLNATGFTNYNEKNFLENEQIKLKDTFSNLNKKGCFVMMSNSYTDFIGKLYNGYKKHTVLASRAVNCKAEGRGKIKEYVITNY